MLWEWKKCCEKKYEFSKKISKFNVFRFICHALHFWPTAQCNVALEFTVPLGPPTVVRPPTTLCFLPKLEVLLPECLAAWVDRFGLFAFVVLVEVLTFDFDPETLVRFFGFDFSTPVLDCDSRTGRFKSVDISSTEVKVSISSEASASDSDEYPLLFFWSDMLIFIMFS